MLATIDLDALLELIWVALVASVVLSTAASACVYGVAKAGESRREGQGAAALRYGALAAAGALTVAAAVAGALAVIISS